MSLLVLVRGVGDIGSAVANHLFTDGYCVVIHDEPLPTTTRRRMAFADAVFDGCGSSTACEPSGLTTCRAWSKCSLPAM